MTLRLCAEPDSIYGLRRQLDRLFGDSLSLQTLQDVQLLVTELVTNSIRHARLASEDEISVTAFRDGPRLRVEVADPGPGFDPATLPGPRPGQAGGFGLFLVNQFSDRWGVSDEGRFTVWFELANVTRETGQQFPTAC